MENVLTELQNSGDESYFRRKSFMDIESLRNLCNLLPKVTEDIKWKSDLCFLIGGKMFFVIDMEAGGGASFKVADEDFELIIDREGMKPAPYFARHKWVAVDSLERLSLKEWKVFSKNSYLLVKNKLPPKVISTL